MPNSDIPTWEELSFEAQAYALEWTRKAEKAPNSALRAYRQERAKFYQETSDRYALHASSAANLK